MEGKDPRQKIGVSLMRIINLLNVNETTSLQECVEEMKTAAKILGEAVEEHVDHFCSELNSFQEELQRDPNTMVSDSFEQAVTQIINDSPHTKIFLNASYLVLAYTGAIPHQTLLEKTKEIRSLSQDLAPEIQEDVNEFISHVNHCFDLAGSAEVQQPAIQANESYNHLIQDLGFDHILSE